MEKADAQAKEGGNEGWTSKIAEGLGVFTNKINRDDVKRGDHIYSWRHAYFYAHHGIYIGDGKVIHFTRGAGQEIGVGTVLDRYLFSSSPSHASGFPCPRCGDHSQSLDGVMLSCIECFLSGGDLHLFQYGVSPAVFVAQARGGTCTLAKSDPQADVLHRASFLLQNGFGGYHIFKNNCEDFAIYCKTGLLINSNSSISMGRSGQATSFAAATSAIVSSPLRFLTTSFSGLLAVGCGMYCVNRLASDIGVRGDVVKVQVENLIVHSGRDGSNAATGIATEQVAR